MGPEETSDHIQDPHLSNHSRNICYILTSHFLNIRKIYLFALLLTFQHVSLKQTKKVNLVAKNMYIGVLESKSNCLWWGRV